MTILEGYYFNGQSPIGISSQMVFKDQEVSLTAGTLISQSHDIEQIKVSPRIGSAQRFIALSNGGQFLCEDNPFLDTLPNESPSEGVVAWLEQRWTVALACVVIVFLTLIAGYFFGLPAAAKRIVTRIPMETELSLGVHTIAYLDKNKWMHPTKLSNDKQEKIMAGFYTLSHGLPTKEYLLLEFREGGYFGANAFALPGGIIVITDEMVMFAKTNEEIMAILAHEIGHIELRHTMRSLLQNSVIGAIVVAITSDASTLSAAITSVPVIIARTKYSRGFETEADDFSFKLLKQKGHSPLAFARLMERLSKEKKNSIGSLSWLSTHPITSERIQRAQAAASQ